MAEENEEDLFADLYDNDEAAQTKAPVVESTPAPAQALPEIATDPTATAPAALPADEDGTPAAVGDGHIQSQETKVPSWDGGANGSTNGDVIMTGNGHIHEEPSRIGIKEDGKMFVGGLNWETTDESLKNYFSQFGEVAECTVMRDAATGRSRGFGFLTFRDPKDVNLVMVKEHYLDGKIIDPKRAIPRDEQERTSKIFVGGVSQEATEEDFKNYFSQYGRVIDATLMMDKDTGRPRGFGFVTFDSEQAVDNTLQGDLMILGKPIEVKKAQPRGNLREDDGFGGRGGRRSRHESQYDQGANQGSQGVGAQQMMNPMASGATGMTPQMMAMWFQSMQRMMAMYSGGMGGGMNMQQMQMYQQMQKQQQQQMQGSAQNQASMQAMMQQMAATQQQPNVGNNSPMPAGASQEARSGTPSSMDPQQQQLYERRKYEQQMMQGYSGYDDGSGSMQQQQQQQQQQQNMGNGYSGGRGRGGGGGRFHRGRGGGMIQQHHIDNQPPPNAPSAPAGAPTGPKNAGLPGANYRGGRGSAGVGGRGGGFHPYRR